MEISPLFLQYVAHVKGLVYISAVVSCLRRWNSSCFADQDKHDKNSSCTIHLKAALLVPRDCEVQRGQSCAPSRAPPAGQRTAGRPVGLGGEARRPPRLTETGSSSVPVAGVCRCEKSCVRGLSEALEARSGRGAKRLWGLQRWGRALPAGRGQREEGDTCFPRPVICVLGEGQCRSRLTHQQALFRAGKEGSVFNI